MPTFVKGYTKRAGKSVKSYLRRGRKLANLNTRIKTEIAFKHAGKPLSKRSVSLLKRGEVVRKGLLKHYTDPQFIAKSIRGHRKSVYK